MIKNVLQLMSKRVVVVDNVKNNKRNDVLVCTTLGKERVMVSKTVVYIYIKC